MSTTQDFAQRVQAIHNGSFPKEQWGKAPLEPAKRTDVGQPKPKTWVDFSQKVKPLVLPPQPSRYTPKERKRLVKIRTRLESRFEKALVLAPEGKGLSAFLAAHPEKKCPRVFVTILCNQMLVKYLKAKKFTKLIALFDEMREQKIDQDAKSYDAVIPSLSTKKVLSKDAARNEGKTRALRLFEEMKRKNLTPAVATYNAILLIHNKSNNRNALELTWGDVSRQTTLKPTRTTYSHMIDYYTRTMNVDPVLRFYELMKERNVLPTLTIFTSIINMFVGLNQAYRAVPFLEELRARGMADVIAYNLWIEICASQNKHEKVMELFEEMKHRQVAPDGVTFNLVIDVCGQRQERKLVESLFADMKYRRLRPDTLTYTALISMYATLDPIVAERTLDEMKTLNIPPIPRTYNSLIEMFCKFRNPPKVLSFLREMKECGVKPNVMTYAVIINMYRLIFKRHRAVHFFEEMTAAGIEPNQRVLDLMKKVLQQREVDVYVSHHESMIAEGLTPSVATYNMSIQHYAEEEEVQKALNDFYEMKHYRMTPDFETYETLILLLKRFGQYPVIARLYPDLVEDDVVPNLRIYNEILKALDCEGEVERGLWAFQKMKEQGIVPDAQAYSTLIRILSRSEFEEAIKMFEEMKQEGFEAGVEVLNSLIAVYHRMGRVPDAEALFEQMKSVADSATYFLMNDLYLQHDQHKAAQFLGKITAE